MKKVEEELFGKALKFHEEGIKLFEQRNYADACEKIWVSIKFATQALAKKYLGRVEPVEESWRNFVYKAFRKAGLAEEKAKEQANYFIKVRAKLHGECFYGTFYEEAEHKPLIEKSVKYLELVKKLLY